MEEKGVKKSEKKSAKKLDFIAWFSELNKDSGNIAGGKGANLAEIYNLKIQVPPGFVITAQAYDYFIEKAGLKEKILELLSKIDYSNTDQLTQITIQIREMIEKAEFPEEMSKDILEAYSNLGVEEGQIKSMSAHHILKKNPEPIFVAVRSSATAEDLPGASFAGQQDTFLNVKGERNLLISVKKCFSSLFTPRATFYRTKKGFEHSKVSLAVIIQKMIDSDKSGVIFSKDPTMKKDNVIIEAVWGLGEGIVSGMITPDKYVISKEQEIKDIEIGNKKVAITRDAGGNKEIVKLKESIANKQVLKNFEIKKLTQIGLKLEEHYKKPQDIEFAIEREEIYIVQTRPITTLEQRHEGGEKELQGEVILKGLAASPGIGVGKIKIVKDLADLGKVNKGDVLVTGMTNPDMVVTMQKAVAIVTDEGGLTAHAAIVSREMGIPAVVGTQEATIKLKEGEIITVDGYTGKIYKGKVAESAQKEVLPVTIETKTKLKVILDLPSFAARAAKTKLTSVGLARLEGIIAEAGKHPQYFSEKNALQEYEEIIYKGIHEIGQYFKEIWVRTSDIRTDEFKNLEGAPKQIEANPMLGMHGIRYGIKHPEIFKAELKAMKRVSDEGKKIGILSPQVISVSEIQKLKEFLKEVGFDQAQVGIMIETPASVQLIKEFCEEKIDFISFGTNDLTQYTLAVDRGNREVQNIFNELDPSILYQIEHVIKVCKEYNVETSICGQAGSKKEMAKFLVEQGIDSISVNADVAADIAKYVAELEGVSEKPKEEESKEEFVKPQYAVDKKEERVNDEKPVDETNEIKHDDNKSIDNNFSEGGEEKKQAYDNEDFPAIKGAEPIEEEFETKEEIIKDIEEDDKVPEEVAVAEEALDEKEQAYSEPQTEATPEPQTEAPSQEQPVEPLKEEPEEPAKEVEQEDSELGERLEEISEGQPEAPKEENVNNKQPVDEVKPEEVKTNEVSDAPAQQESEIKPKESPEPPSEANKEPEEKPVDEIKEPLPETQPQELEPKEEQNEEVLDIF